MSFDKLRMNGKWLISFVVSLSNHEGNQRVQRFLKQIFYVAYPKSEKTHLSYTLLRRFKSHDQRVHCHTMGKLNIGKPGRLKLC